MVVAAAGLAAQGAEWRMYGEGRGDREIAKGRGKGRGDREIASGQGAEGGRGDREIVAKSALMFSWLRWEVRERAETEAVRSCQARARQMNDGLAD